MNKFTFFSRLAAVLLTAMMALPMYAQWEVEDKNLDLGTHGKGEIVTLPQFEGQYFYVKQGEYLPTPESASTQGDWGAYTRFKYTNTGSVWTENADRISQYKIDAIWCMNTGTDHIQFNQYEIDENHYIVKQIRWDISITVAGGSVEVGTWDENDDPNPNVTVLKDTTIHFGYSYSIYNYVGFRYVSWCQEKDGELVNDWFFVDLNKITVTSSDEDVVEVYWDGRDYQFTGKKRGTATITVSVPAEDYYGTSEPMHIAKTVQYKVKVTGDKGPELTFVRHDEVIDELVIDRWQDGYEPDFDHIWPDVMADGDYISSDKELTVTSSNTAVATIDDPSSYVVAFTYQGYGTTIITAVLKGDDYIEDAVATLKLTYVDPYAVDLYFVDEQGNPVTSIEVGLAYNFDIQDWETTLPFTPRIIFEQNGKDLFDNLGPGLEIAAEDPSIVDAYWYDEDHKLFITGYDIGTTDIVASFDGLYQYSAAEARLTVRVRKPVTLHVSSQQLIDGEFNIIDTDSGCLGVTTYPPTVWLEDDLGNAMPDMPMSVRSSNEKIVKVSWSDITDQTRAYHYVDFDERWYGEAIITIAFAGDDAYCSAETSFKYQRLMNLDPMAECEVQDINGNPLPEDITLTEGDFLALKHLVRKDGEHMSYNYIATASSTGRSCWKLNRETQLFEFYPHAAGLDTFYYDVYRYSCFDLSEIDPKELTYWDYRETYKVPVTIMPYIEPISHCYWTSSSLNPANNQNMTFSSTGSDIFNQEKGQLEIHSVVSATNLQVALDSMATGKKEWNDLLPGATTFNVNPGKGTIKIKCKVVEGYELKVLVRGQGTATIDQTSEEEAKIEYEVDVVSAVLIYLNQKGHVPNPAPARAAESEPNAIITSIVVVAEGDEPTAIEQTSAEGFGALKVEKRILNGQLIIIRNGEQYNAQGQIVK